MLKRISEAVCWPPDHTKPNETKTYPHLQRLEEGKAQQKAPQHLPARRPANVSPLFPVIVVLSSLLCNTKQQNNNGPMGGGGGEEGPVLSLPPKRKKGAVGCCQPGGPSSSLPHCGQRMGIPIGLVSCACRKGKEKCWKTLPTVTLLHRSVSPSASEPVSQSVSEWRGRETSMKRARRWGEEGAAARTSPSRPPRRSTFPYSPVRLRSAAVEENGKQKRRQCTDIWRGAAAGVGNDQPTGPAPPSLSPFLLLLFRSKRKIDHRYPELVGDFHSVATNLQADRVEEVAAFVLEEKSVVWCLFSSTHFFLPTFFFLLCSLLFYFSKYNRNFVLNR